MPSKQDAPRSSNKLLAGSKARAKGGEQFRPTLIGLRDREQQVASDRASYGRVTVTSNLLLTVTYHSKEQRISGKNARSRKKCIPYKSVLPTC